MVPSLHCTSAFFPPHIGLLRSAGQKQGRLLSAAFVGSMAAESSCPVMTSSQTTAFADALLREHISPATPGSSPLHSLGANLRVRG